MIADLELALRGRSDPVVLCLGAHCDDIEIGCGGALLRLRERLPGAEIHWAILSGDARRHPEARESARRFLGDGAESRVRCFSFTDGFLPWEGAGVKATFETPRIDVVRSVPSSGSSDLELQPEITLILA